jgi:hypothetical protein
MKHLFSISILFCIAVLSGCAPQIADGGGSRGGNPVVMGNLLFDNGLPASATLVTLIPQSYNPVSDSLLKKVYTTFTDVNGCYSIVTQDTGLFTIQAVSTNPNNRIRSIQTNIHIASDTVLVQSDTLHKPGYIKIMVTDSMKNGNSYFYIPGTLIFTMINNASNYIVLDSVPAAFVPLVSYGTISNSVFTPVRYNIPVISQDTTMVANPAWKYARELALNTTPSGADVSENVYGFPVLVRLNSGNFDFSQTQTNGSDIRFTKTDNAPLAYEIERWDAQASLAEVWVNVDTIIGNDSTQSFIMYWGASATSLSNSAAVFDTTNGFQGVWHLGETAGTTAFDATGNHYNGTVSDTAPIAANGAIGSCKQFDGVSNYIRVVDGAQSKLNFSQTSPHTISAWVNLDTLDSVTHFIAGKSELQYFLKVYPWPKGNLCWEFTEYYSNEGWHILYYPAVSKTWKFIEGRFDGNIQQLFVDGVLVSDSILYSADSLPRNNAQDFMMGRLYTYHATRIDKFGYFIGKIDEVCVSNVARSDAWTKLCYMNQRQDDKLIIYK